MRPTDLKYPVNQKNKRAFIEDGVWVIPDFPDKLVFLDWNSKQLFENDNPVYIEYCSGNGSWIVEKALKHPEINWVAVEKKFKRVRKIWSKKKNHGCNNLIVVFGEALNATKHYFPKKSVEKIYINFPDPWPKRRHKKHRLINSAFIEEMEHILLGEAEISVVTDDANYSEEIIEEFASYKGFCSIYPDPYFVCWDGDYGTSWFCELWQQKGREIRYHRFEKV